MVRFPTDILKWAVGFKRPVSEIDVIDESVLFEAVQAHRLAGRFLHRVNEERPHWWTKSLHQALAVEKMQVQANLRRQVKAIREVSAALADERRPLITVKGFSAYALTGDQRNIRLSTDVDMFAADLDDLRETLLGLGYSEEDPSDLAPHEFAKLQRDDIIFDIHRYFPVLGYTNFTAAWDLLPERNPGCWDQTGNVPGLQFGQIHYQDLLEHSLYGLAPETNDLLVPDPNMCALIFCAHAFQNAEQTMGVPWLVVCLAELANLCDMTRHPRFDQQKFRALVSKFDAHYAVELIGDLLETYLGFNPLLCPPSDSRTSGADGRDLRFLRRPWRMVIFERVSFWAVLDRSVNDLLVPYGLHMEAIIDQLGANTVVATSSQRRRYTALSADNGEILNRVLVQGSQGRRLPIQFSVAWTEETLSFEISLPELPRGCYDLIIVNLGSFNCDTLYKEHKVSFSGTTPGGWSLTRCNNGYTLHLSFPWAVVSNFSPESTLIRILLGAVRVKNRELWAATLLPLNVMRAADQGM